jgi:hypothetical protein
MLGVCLTASAAESPATPTAAAAESKPATQAVERQGPHIYFQEDGSRAWMPHAASLKIPQPKITLVVFLGDNGLPVIRGKTWCYEPGVRVPLLMRGPGIEPGSVRQDLASEVDLMPTILRAADVALPDGVAGQPLLPNSAREFLFTEMNFHEPQILRVQRSVRNEHFKLLLNLTPVPDQAPVELFDLRTDPGETQNLADDATWAEVRRQLEAALQAWREQTADPTLDAARVRRWQDAAARWGKLPKVPAGPSMVVHIPDGELELLK